MYDIEKYIFDFRSPATVKENERKVAAKFKSTNVTLWELCADNFCQPAETGVFLMPTSITWRKKIEGNSIYDSSSISDARKKVIRIAVGQAERKGIRYEIENPLSKESFDRFLAYYREFTANMGYDEILNESYFEKRKPENMYAINIFDQRGEYIGGRLVAKVLSKLVTDFRAARRDNTIKEGYDIVCEKMFYDLAVQTQSQFMTLGSEFNLRGLWGKKVSLILNKLKLGYFPIALRHTPRLYINLNFLKNEEFDTVFFFSYDNNSQIKTRKDESPVINFIIGGDFQSEVFQSIIERSVFPVRIYDKNFQLLQTH